MTNVSKSHLTPYELSALDDAASSISPYRTPVSALVHVLEDDEAARQGDVFARALWRILAALGHVAAKSVRGERLDELRRWAMRPVRSMNDIVRLDLWEIDEASSGVMPKYALLGALVGLVSGSLGLRGIAAGKAIFVLLALREVHEHAMRYGFDVEDAEERAFAVRVFVASLCPHRLPREAGPADLARVTSAARRIARVTGLVDVACGAVRMVEGNKKSRRRAPHVRRLAPAAAAIGMALYGIWLLRGVAQVAAAAYRERFVARKHHMAVPELRGLPRATFNAELTSSAQREACPPAPCEKNDEARPASAAAVPAR